MWRWLPNPATGEYLYVTSPIRCDGSGAIVYDPFTGFSDGYEIGWRHPSNLVGSVSSMFAFGSGYRIFTSACNTHLLAVNRFGPAGKLIDGVSNGGLP